MIVDVVGCFDVHWLCAAAVAANRNRNCSLHAGQHAPGGCPSATPRSPEWSDRESGLVRRCRRLGFVVPAVKALLQERHLHEYSVFANEYRRIARDLGLPRNAQPPSKSTYYHWLSGQMQRLPQGYHCVVLEQMFPGWTVRDLFAGGSPRQHPVPETGLLAPIPSVLNLDHLAGLWATAFVFEDAHHVDLTTVIVDRGALTGTNWPPAPRTEGQAVGYHNDLALSAAGRHLIGTWRNSSDSYYYGAVHLAVLPSETVMDGHYTSVLSDTQVVANRWRWVRVDPTSTVGVDLATVVLGDPAQLYDVLAAYAPSAPPIPLCRLTADRPEKVVHP